jgi:hypothetical protein
MTSQFITVLDRQRKRALTPNYKPDRGEAFERWTKLLHQDKSSIGKNPVKSRAHRYAKIIHDHSRELFELCADATTITSLGAIRDKDDIFNITAWWDDVTLRADVARTISLESSGHAGKVMPGPDY